MYNTDLKLHAENFSRTQAIIGNEHTPAHNTPENRSRERLLRAQAGLLHLLTEVIPQISDAKQRDEVYLLVEGVHDLTRFEQCDADKESNVQGDIS